MAEMGIIRLLRAAIHDRPLIYDSVRRAGAVVFDHDRYWVTSYELCETLLTDPRLSSDRGALEEPAYSGAHAGGGNLLFMDGSAHTRLRRVISEGLEESWTRNQIDGAVEHVLKAMHGKLPSGVDAVRDLAEPTAGTVIGLILGMDPDEWWDLVADLRLMTDGLEPTIDGGGESGAAAGYRVMHYFRRNSARLTSRSRVLQRVEVAASVGEISELEALSTPVLLLHAGFENSANAAADAILYLVASDGAAFAQLSMASLCDELLRLISPAQFVVRVANEEIVLPDQTIDAGALVYLGLAAANHDPNVFSHTRSVSPQPARRAHLAFGKGPRYCLGARVARTELSCLIRHVGQLGALQVAGQVLRRPRVIFSSLESVPLRSDRTGS